MRSGSQRPRTSRSRTSASSLLRLVQHRVPEHRRALGTRLACHHAELAATDNELRVRVIHLSACAAHEVLWGTVEHLPLHRRQVVCRDHVIAHQSTNEKPLRRSLPSMWTRLFLILHVRAACTANT